MKNKLTLVALVGIIGLLNSGCEPGPQTDEISVTPKVAPSTNQVENVQRFTIKSQGTFSAGYDNATREIFILKDNFTGTEYLGVTDCTLIRIRVKAKEEAVSDAIDVAVDIATQL